MGQRTGHTLQGNPSFSEDSSAAFLEHFGSSPMQYLLAYRLNHVRRKLLQEPPVRGKILDVANEVGFWHMGDFASHYRRFFDELPSETFANSR